MLKNFDIEKIDTNKLADCLEKSRRASYSAREALCIEIGVNFNDLDFGQTAPRDFAIQLVAYLKQMRNTEALLRLCQAIKYKTNILNTGYLIRSSLLKVLLATGSVTVLVLLLRFLGMLQVFELGAFDFLMWLRPSENQDSYVSIIGITGGEEISDKDLLQLIEYINKNENYKPSVIGLDIYRDKPTGAKEDHSNLVDYLKKNQNIVATCLVDPESESAHGSKPPYPEIQEAQLGFTDVFPDDYDVIRRHLFFLPEQEDSPCNTVFSFSFQLALNYLESLDPPIIPEPPKEEYFKIKNTIFKPLGNRVGGYQNPDQQFTLDAFQMLLNYRSPKPGTPTFPTYNASRVKGKLFKPSKISDLKGHVVLIGYTSLDPNENKDLHSTPYGYYGDKKMPGVLIHAHMVSQILNAVLEENRPLLSVWPWWLETVWIWVWSLIGGGIAWRYCSFSQRQRLVGVAFIFLSLIVLGVFCWLFLGELAIWVPLVPSALALILVLFVVWEVIPYHERIIPYIEIQVQSNR